MTQSPQSTTPILLVDDDDIDAELVKRCFKRNNITNPLYKAADGVEALKMLHNVHEEINLPQPCILLIDINMPRMNGIELLREIRKDNRLKRNVAFILTTSDRSEDKLLCYDLQTAGYILKEQLNDLAEMLKRYCNINKMPNEDTIDNSE